MGPLCARRSARRGAFLGCLLLLAGQCAAQWQFTEVSLAAGLDYEQGFDGMVGEPFLVSGGVAAGDFDRDGWTDLYVVRGDRGATLLFRNLGLTGPGDIAFEEVSESAGLAIEGDAGCGPTFADFDGDGWLDLLIGGVGGTTPPRLFRNLGLQPGPQPPPALVAFEEITEASGIFSLLDTMSAAFGDYDRDGDLDIFLTHWSLGGGNPISAPHLWRNDGTGSFGPVDFASGIAPVYQDLDWSFSPTFTDLDNDGWPDLLVAGDFGTSQVFRNRGDGTFEVLTGPVISDENGMGSAVGDIDNDGDLDWFVSSIWDPDGMANGGWGITGNRLYRNEGDWQEGLGFEDGTESAGVREGYWGWGSCFADLDNDGDLDLFHTNGFPAEPANEFFEDPTRLFLNDGTGAFTENSAALGIDDTGQGRGVVCFDADNDGDIDLFVANNSGPPRLYRNDGGNESNFLQVRLRGGGLNSEAIGARIELTTSGTTQMREIRAGSNYVSQNPTRAHFGVGDAEVIDEIRIHWPDGEETVRLGVAANQLLNIDQRIGPTAVAIPTMGYAGRLLLVSFLVLVGVHRLRPAARSTRLAKNAPR